MNSCTFPSSSFVHRRFMGIIDELPVQPDVCKAWVLSNGTLASVDNAFTSWFGYKPQEVIGNTLNQIMVDPRALEE